MYVSLTDVIAAVATLIVGVLGLLLLIVKLINRHRRQNGLHDDR